MLGFDLSSISETFSNYGFWQDIHAFRDYQGTPGFLTFIS